jgi:hypothetical protein
MDFNKKKRINVKNDQLGTLGGKEEKRSSHHHDQAALQKNVNASPGNAFQSIIELTLTQPRLVT